MRMKRMACGLLVAIGVAVGLAGGSAMVLAQEAKDYPSKPIRFIVGFGAGGGTDILARIVAEQLSRDVGQPVLVENRTGAGGRIAVEYVQNQPADGHLVAIGAIGQLAVTKAIYPQVSFHPTKTLIPLTMFGSYPLVLSGRLDDKIKTVQDLVAYGKANPDKANYPSSSPAFTLPAELFKLKTGMPGTLVPYRSAAEMLLSVIGGQTLFAFADSAVTIQQAKSGKLRSFAIANPKRLPELPDVPTFEEAGLGDVDVRPQWIGAFVAAGTPPAIVARLEAALRKALADESVRARIRKASYFPEGMPGSEFRARINSDIETFEGIVKEAKLKFEL